MSVQELIFSIRTSLSGGGVSTVLVVVLAAIAVIIAIVAGIFYALYLSSPRGRVGTLLQGKASRRSRPASWVTRLFIVAVIVLTVIAAEWYMGRTQTCIQCHKKSGHVAALAESTHEQVACLSCHRPPGLTGVVRQWFDYARWLYVYGATKQVPRPEGRTIVENGSCLRCHQAVLKGTSVFNGIRVRHSDFLEEGATCEECHNAVAHPQAVLRANEPTMDTCLRCHDGKTASYECDTCHSKDAAANSDISRYPKIALAGGSDSCYACHAEEACTICHGVKMPHPENWVAGPVNGTSYPGHAREGFAQRELCARCHFASGTPFVADDASCACHGLFGRQHGGAAWVKEHGLQATGAKPGEFSACFDCHSNGFCSACHPSSYNDLYAPVGGNDTYVRDIPLPPSYSDY